MKVMYVRLQHNSPNHQQPSDSLFTSQASLRQTIIQDNSTDQYLWRFSGAVRMVRVVGQLNWEGCEDGEGGGSTELGRQKSSRIPGCGQIMQS